MTRDFTVEQLKMILWQDGDEFKVIKEEQIGTSRWANDYEAVFKEKSTGKLYGMGYRRGTGDEGERPFEHDNADEVVPCPEMEAYEVTVTKYRDKK